MNGGKDREGGGVEGQATPTQVPIGWQRRVDPNGVHYISPSGSVLSGLDQVKGYLLTDGTCKCGLECPLTLTKVFNFDPVAAVKQRTAEDVRADDDVTKLCIHKRKLLAVATLHRSMETHPSLTTLHRSMETRPSLTLSGLGGGAATMAAARPAAQRTARTRAHEAPPTPMVPDCKNPFRMMMAAPHHFPPELTTPQPQQELYPGYLRQQQQQRLANSEPLGARSPYRASYTAMLSPPPHSSHLYSDGSLSPRMATMDPTGSPVDGFPRTGAFSFPSPGAMHSSGHRTPLSSPPPSMLLLHGSPPAQTSCAMVGRTSTPLSPNPTSASKSPVMMATVSKVRQSFPDVQRTAFHHKVPPHPPRSPSAMPPSCALQKKPMTSEKDPLGILDPIPPATTPPGFPPSGGHSQVPMMNVGIPPAIVPLPSNLPLPSVKPGPVGHGGSGHLQRTPQASLSPSPVTSPAPSRMEASPHRSRSSSTSSDHGGFAMPQGVKAPPLAGSPRSAMGSPCPAMPSSPSSSSSKPDSAALHPYKDATPCQLLSGMSSGGVQHNPMYAPGSGASSQPQKGHPALLGMPLNQILNQQNAASFPASSLLSAAAKAQLANQNKLSGSSGGGGGGSGSSAVGVGNASGGAQGGARVSSTESHGTLTPMLPPNSTMLLTMSEGGGGGGGGAQSGRAALRDKLMAQQRDPLRNNKRKQANGIAAAPTNHDGLVLNMLAGKPGLAGARLPGPAEPLRKVARLGAGMSPHTSMAQLLQSMSCQSSHATGNNRPSPPMAGPGPMHYPDGPGLAQHSALPQQRLLNPGEALHCQVVDSGGGHQFQAMMSQMQATSMGSCGPLAAPGGLPPLGHPNANPPPLSHPGQQQHPQQQNHLHAGLGRSSLAGMPLNGNDRSCSQRLSESGDPSSLNCGISNPQLGALQPHHHHQGYPQSGQGQQPLHHLPQGFQGSQPAYPDLSYQNSSSSGSMAHLYHNYQGCPPENIPQTQMSSQAMTPLPEPQGMLSHPQSQFGEGTPSVGMPGPERLPGGGGGGPETVDAIYRAVVDAASKGMHVVITTSLSGTTQASPVPAHGAMNAFTASMGDPSGGHLPSHANAIPHRAHRPEEDAKRAVLNQHPRPRQARPGRPQKNPEQGKGGVDGPSEVAHEYFRSPGSGTPRGAQWDAQTPPPTMHLDGHSTPWSGEEFLECSTQVRSGPAPPCASDTPLHDHHGLLHVSSDSNNGAFLDNGTFRFANCGQINYKERLEQTVERLAHMNGHAGPPTSVQFSARGYAISSGNEILGPPRQELTGDDQSPGSSTSLEGPLAKDFLHYNGHFNGGCAPSPSDTKSLSSEEDLRHPDSPSSDLLHYRPRGFHVGELVWGVKGFPPWPGTLAGEEQLHNTGLQLQDQGKVESDKRKALNHDLDALDRVAKRSRKAGKLNNHLEAAIHEAMSELDKMSGTVHQLPSRDRPVKLPKTKRRKISR